MLPALTVAAAHWPRRRLLGGIASAVLSVAALATALPVHPTEAAHAPSLAASLPDGTWALAIPVSWLAAPIPGLRSNDRVDVLALRPGDRASATVVGADLVVLSSDDRLLIVGATAEDATSIAVARASGHILVPLLRSIR